MPAIDLTAAQRKVHRSHAHHLDPVLMIGADGLTAAVLQEANRALSAHALIKVRVLNDDRREREALLTRLADVLNAAPVQHIGKALVLWRPLPQKAAPSEPKRGDAPRVMKVVSFGNGPAHRPRVKKVIVLGNQRLTSGGTVKRARSRLSSVKKKAGAGR